MSSQTEVLVVLTAIYVLGMILSPIIVTRRLW